MQLISGTHDFWPHKKNCHVQFHIYVVHGTGAKLVLHGEQKMLYITKVNKFYVEKEHLC